MINCFLLSVFLFSLVKGDGVLTLPIVRTKVQQSSSFNLHHLRHSVAESGTETYSLHPNKEIFTLNLKVNGLDYNLSVDTGSSDLFIKGENLQGEPVQKFICNSCATQNRQIKIGYLDGKLSTYLHNSTIQLGEHTFNENILVAYKTNHIQNFLKIGGIVGLSFQQKARNPYPNFINTLIAEKIIEKYVFGLKLNFNSPNSSFITFGGFDEKYVDSNERIQYYQILQNTYSYKLKVQKLHFGSQQLQLTIALIDSGNTCVSLDAKYQKQMLEQLNLSGNQCQFKKQKNSQIFKALVCNISDFDALPVITLQMDDGNNYSWQKQYYLDRCYLMNQTNNPFYRCETFIESVEKHKAGFYLGAAWMLKYYTVFDLDKRRIGFGKSVNHPTVEDFKDQAKQNMQKWLAKNRTGLPQDD